MARSDATLPSALQELDANTRPVVDDQAGGERVVEHLQRSVALQARPERAGDLAAGRVARVEHAPHAVRAFASERRLAVLVAIERGAPGHQLADVARAFVHEHLDRIAVAEAGAGFEGVREVQRGRVVLANGRRHTALGVAGVAFGAAGLCQEEDVSVPHEIDGGSETGDAAADDEEIGPKGH